MTIYAEVKKLQSIKEKDGNIELILEGWGSEITLCITKENWIEIGCKIGADAEIYEKDRYYQLHPEDIPPVSAGTEHATTLPELNDTVAEINKMAEVLARGISEQYKK